MNRLWHKLIHLGIDETTDEQEVMYIQICNGLSVLVSIWMVSLVPLILPYWPDSRVFAINGVVFPLLWPLILLMNYKKKYMLARVYLTATSMAIITINVLSVGGQTENHLFIVMYIASALVTYPKLKQFAAVAAVGLAHFVCLEMWFRFHGPLMTGADPAYYELIRFLSVLNIPILFIIIALYHKNLLLQTQKSLRERRQAFQNLLDHAGQGFLTVDGRLAVQQEYSKECLHLFERDIAGAAFAELLSPHDRSQRMLLEDILQTVFQGDGLQREVCLSLMPLETNVRGKPVQLQYKWIEQPPSAPARMMVVMTDISEKRQLEHHMEQERRVLRMVVKAVRHDRDLQELLEEYRTFAEQGVRPLFGREASVADDLSELFLHVHTFKGNFAQFDFIRLPHRLHDLETQIEVRKQLLTHSPSAFASAAAPASAAAFAPASEHAPASEPSAAPSPVSAASLRAWLNRIDWLGWLAEDMRILHDYLGDRLYTEQRYVSVDTERLRQLERRVPERCSGPEAAWLVAELRKLQYCSLRELLSMYPAYIEQLAEQTGKDVEPLTWEGDDVLVDPSVYAPFCRTLIHVFRNSVDHGIELPEDRVSSGKHPRGRIGCRIVESDREIELTLFNDGRPINVAAVRSIALQRGMCTAEQFDVMSEDERRMLIVREGFSSKRSATAISGRGVGLSAVYKALQQLRGTMRIDSDAERGTAFTFVLPRRGAAAVNTTSST